MGSAQSYSGVYGPYDPPPGWGSSHGRLLWFAFQAVVRHPLIGIPFLVLGALYYMVRQKRLAEADEVGPSVDDSLDK
jgi:hypothetical protein